MLIEKQADVCPIRCRIGEGDHTTRISSNRYKI